MQLQLNFYEVVISYTVDPCCHIHKCSSVRWKSTDFIKEECHCKIQEEKKSS